MKKLVLSILGLALAPSFAIAQVQNASFDPQNARLGESIEYCLTHKKYAEMLQDPNAVQLLAQDSITRAIELQQPQLESTTLYVPIVFHVLHNDGEENISNEQILDAFAVLNEDYSLSNSDASNVANAFNPSNPSATVVPTNPNIQFVLATKAPDGTCFSGITRTMSPLTFVASSQQGSDQVNAIKTGNDVYQGEWPGDKYLNVFICKGIGGAIGYTHKPSSVYGTSMTNGIWLLHDYFGSIGTSAPIKKRVLTHESGHWFNLDHPWGPTNNPGVSSNCNSDDGVSDTPDCIGLTSCILTSNSCNGDYAHWGFDQIDNAENFMEYSFCNRMFTPGQVSRMRSALNSSVGGRNNLTTAANLAATGADGSAYLCKADFEASRVRICAGGSIDFTDLSYNEVTGWDWTFTGGTPSTSTAQNPTITYNTSGVYEVKLEATDGSINDIETKSAYITVLPAPETIPFLETFETLTTLTNIAEWEVVNYGNNAKFELTTSAGHTGSNSAKLPNYGQSAGNVDELISSTVDLSDVTSSLGVTLSFRYAYKKRQTGNNELLKVKISNDCGDSWVTRKTLQGSILGADVSSSNWTPSESDWVTIHMTNISSTYWTNNFRYKFEFESDGGNNLYLDNINIYPGSPSNELIVGVEEQLALGHLTLFPNPTEDELNVLFDLNNAQQVDFWIQDVTGKRFKTNHIQGQPGANMVVLGTDELSSGVYFLQVHSEGAQQSIKFVVK